MMTNQPFPLPVIAGNQPLYKVAPGVERLQVIMVNLYFISYSENSQTRWLLVDAGMGCCAARIKKAAAHLFPGAERPEAILLTHGHFDHVGALAELAEAWDVPVYAHRLELPYLNGQSAYPPPDPSVGGGALALLAGLYPKRPINLGKRLQPFPEDGHIPGLPGWQAVHTPGHTAGHVSFFREQDKVLIAGDAFVTVKQESLLSVLSQKQEIHGPPAYFTSDWQAAEASVSALAALEPTVAATGHGVPMQGERLRQNLAQLAQHFRQMAVPKQGRYVRQPARTSEQGVVEVPPPVAAPWWLTALNMGLALLAGFGLGYGAKKIWNKS